MRRTKLMALIGAALLVVATGVLSSPDASASIVTLGDPTPVNVLLKGVGLGARPTVITYQQDGTEWGSVTYSGTGDGSKPSQGEVINPGGGVKTGASQTQLVTVDQIDKYFGKLGLPNPTSWSQVAMIFDVNQLDSLGSDSLNLHGLTLDLYTENQGTSTPLAQAVYSPAGGSITLHDLHGGQGEAGWDF